MHVEHRHTAEQEVISERIYEAGRLEMGIFS